MTNPFSIHVTADKWGTGNRNDCYWNIAKNQLGEGASAQEVAALTEELIALNNEKAGKAGERDTLVETGQQIFIPLEQSMDEIQASITNAQTELSTKQENVNTKLGTLTDANTNVQTALGKLQGAKSAMDGTSSEDEGYESLQQAYQQALNEYNAAIQEQQTAQSELEQAEQELTEVKENIVSFQEEYKEIMEDYEDEKEEYQTQIEEFDQAIGELEGQINETNDELEGAKQAAKDAATVDQENAKNMGLADDGNGNATVENEEVLGQVLGETPTETGTGTSTGTGVGTGTGTGEPTDVPGSTETGTGTDIGTGTGTGEPSDVPSESGTTTGTGTETGTTTGTGTAEIPASLSAYSADVQSALMNGETVTIGGQEYKYDSEGQSVIKVGDLTKAQTEEFEAAKAAIENNANWKTDYSDTLINSITTGYMKINNIDTAVVKEDQLAALNDYIGRLQTYAGITDPNSSSYDAGKAQMLGGAPQSMADLYIEKINDPDKTIAQANAEMDTYNEMVGQLADAYNTAQEEYEKGSNRTPAEMMLSGIDDYDFSTFYRFDLVKDNYFNVMSSFDGTQDTIGSVNELIEVYNTQTTNMQEGVGPKITEESKQQVLANNPSVSEEQLDELVNLYNNFMTNTYDQTQGWFASHKKEAKQVKKDAEALLNMYFNGGVSSLNLDSVLTSLRNTTTWFSD